MKSMLEYEYTSHGSDPVTEQYQSLPYPPVSEVKLNDEEQYYKGNTLPKSFFPHHALENINHYLHRGKENFE